MTEAEIIDGKNSNYEIEQTQHTSDIDDKHSSSSDSPGETTGDFDGSSTSFRHEEDDDIAGDNDNSTNRSPSAENDENRSIVSIHQKDDEIKRLTNENKRLRSVLCEKEIREKELVEELERHAELVERQQNQLDDIEGQLNQRQKQIAALRQQLQRTQQQLNSAVLQQNQSKNMPAVKTKSSANGNHDEAATAAFLEELCTTTGVANGGNPDEVCAALSTFIEKNRSNSVSNVSEGDDVAPELIEYLNKLIAENSSSSNNQASNNDESNSLMSMLFDQYGDYEGSVGTNGMPAKSAGGKPISRSHGATVRDVVGMGGPPRTSGQTFYRGSAASSANPAALSAPAMARGKFSQHIGDGPTISTAPAASHSQTSRPILSASSSSNQLNGISGSSAVIQKSSFSHGAPQQSVAPSSSSSNAKPLSEEEQRIVTEMQDCIATNVAQLGSRPLNTFVIAHQCKRLMLAYNIGQRLFAKAVMCQVVKSQGSLSELLSKPRAWHKLTDKGREAFRRIYGWLSDDVAIELLCQLSPRRVAMPGDRIEHPTGESLLDHGDSAVYEAEFQASRAAALASSGGLDESLNGLLSTSQYPDDDDELKAPSSHLNKTFSSPGTSSVSGSPPHASAPSLNMNFAASPVSASASSASSMKGGLPNGAFGGSIPAPASNHSRWRHDDIPREKIIGIFEAEKAKLRDQVKQNTDEGISLANSLIGDESTPNSPRNASIANVARILRGDLVPITQTQFEKYPTLDTEEVVKEVKDYLSHHSISQRQFGEAVLGLSQGSVSDLLARPKSWSMLTHKGREPFIRMRIFLDEHAHEEQPPAALHQNNEKMEGLNFGMEEECRDTPEPDVLHKALMIKNEVEPPIFESAKPVTAALSDDQPQSDEMPPLDTTDLCRRVKEFLLKNSISQRAFGEHVLNMTSGTVSDLLSRPKSWQHLTPKGREAYTRMLRFMGDERAMDTLRSNVIARAANNNGVITAVSANGGGLADLFPATADLVETEESKYPSTVGPTTAASATVEFITSPLPATAFSGVSDRLSQFLMEQNGAESDISVGLLKRKASFGADGMMDNGLSFQSGKKIPRFQRTVITDEQKEALFFIFSHEQRPSAKMIDQLAVRLNLSSRTVTNWFHNHRTRQKAKEAKLATEAAANGLPPPPSKPNPLQVIDPSSKEWYADLVFMLSQNAGSNNNNVMNQNGGYLMSGDYSSFLDASLNGDDMDETMSNGSLLKFDDIANGDNDQVNGHYGGGGVELEEEEEAGAAEHRVSPKYGSLNKLIARMHDRLGAESS